MNNNQKNNQQFEEIEVRETFVTDRGRMKKCTFIKSTQISKQNIHLVIQNKSREFASFMINTVIFMFKILRKYLKNYFFDELKKQFNNQDLYFDYENLLQRIIQYYLLIKNSILNIMIIPLLTKYYSQNNIAFEQQEQLLGEDNNQELQEELRPRWIYDDFDYRREDFYQRIKKNSTGLTQNQVQNPSFFFNSQEENRFQNQRISQKLKRILANSIYTNIQDIPFYQTFPIVEEIIKEYKFWRVYKLIEYLVKTIRELFTYQILGNEFNRQREAINDPQNYLCIMNFIISHFVRVRNCNNQILKERLVYKIKFMLEFDEILHKDIKYIRSSLFCDFWLILSTMFNEQNP